MRRSDREQSGEKGTSRRSDVHQMFSMKAHGRRFLLPKCFDLVAEPRLLLLLIILATLVTTLLVFDFQAQMTLTMFSAILAKSTTTSASSVDADGVTTTDDTSASNLQLKDHQRCLICM